MSKAVGEVLLSAKGLTKRFGGLAAVDNVSIDLYRNHIHAVIGPNGAGKSTLTNLLSGDLTPTSGSVALVGADITGWTPEKISRQGLGRSYQKTNIFLPFTVWDNVHLAAWHWATQTSPAGRQRKSLAKAWAAVTKRRISFYPLPCGTTCTWQPSRASLKPICG